MATSQARALDTLKRACFNRYLNFISRVRIPERKIPIMPGETVRTGRPRYIRDSAWGTGKVSDAHSQQRNRRQLAPESSELFALLAHSTKSTSFIELRERSRSSPDKDGQTESPSRFHKLHLSARMIRFFRTNFRVSFWVVEIFWPAWNSFKWFVNFYRGSLESEKVYWLRFPFLCNFCDCKIYIVRLIKFELILNFYKYLLLEY